MPARMPVLAGLGGKSSGFCPTIPAESGPKPGKIASVPVTGARPSRRRDTMGHSTGHSTPFHLEPPSARTPRHGKARHLDPPHANRIQAPSLHPPRPPPSSLPKYPRGAGPARAAGGRQPPVPRPPPRRGPKSSQTAHPDCHPRAKRPIRTPCPGCPDQRWHSALTSRSDPGARLRPRPQASAPKMLTLTPPQSALRMYSLRHRMRHKTRHGKNAARQKITQRSPSLAPRSPAPAQ
jgi:hypothetical protein